MSNIWRKLNLKEQREILVSCAPASFEAAIDERDTGWSPLGQVGFAGVRQVAIDDDWSALRFRRVEFIKRR